MIAAKEIRDRDRLAQWLIKWPESQGMDEEAARKVAVSIAHRVAMRVFPIAWEWFSGPEARKRALTALPFLRCNLISGVASTCPTPEIKASATTAFAASATATTATASATTPAARASASATAFATAATTPASTFVFATASATTPAAFWQEIQNDAGRFETGENVMTTALWQGEVPLWFDEKMKVVRSNLSENESVWNFWLRWWERSINGDLLPDALLTEIALIPDEDWEKGPTHTSGLIAEIEKRHLLREVRMR